MTDPTVLYEPRRTGLISLALFAGIAAISAVLGTNDEALRVPSWVFAGFFGVCALAALKTIIDRDRLVLTREGLRIFATGLRLEFAWSQIQGFYTFQPKTILTRPRTLVGIDFVEGEGGIFSTPSMRWANRVTRRDGTSTRVVKGHAGSLPSTYGLNADELVNLLEGWRRANRGTPPDGTP